MNLRKPLVSSSLPLIMLILPAISALAIVEWGTLAAFVLIAGGATLALIIVAIERPWIYPIISLVVGNIIMSESSFFTDTRLPLSAVATVLVPLIAIINMLFRNESMALALSRGGQLARFMYAFIVWCIISAMAGFIVGNEQYFLLADLFNLLVIPLYYFFPLLTVSSEEEARLVVKWLMIVTSIASLWSLARYFLTDAFLGGAEVEGVEVGRLLSAPAGTSALFLPIAVTLGFDRTQFPRGLSVIMVVIFGLTTVATFTRGYYLMALAGLAFFVFAFPAPLTRRLRITISIMAALAMIAGVWSFVGAIRYDNPLSLVLSRMASSFDFEMLSQQRREAEIRAAIDVVQGNPVWGKGLGAVIVIPTWLTLEKVPVVHYIHNSYAALVVRTGIVGLFIYMGFAIEYVLKTWKGARNATSQSTRLMLLGLLASYFGVVVEAMGAATLFWGIVPTLMGLTTVILHTSETEMHQRKQQYG